ncbi:SAE2-domain-containing protein [Viridothelium virens]|uniref:SAE2-domain-containing protein n=1 Tax=Viridothelium virens TaxID=1048519 RepID=A0A6A6GSW9_VIRVR|nr:SAE2-domain-containing protein [Viridothelium virens]
MESVRLKKEVQRLRLQLAAHHEQAYSQSGPPPSSGMSTEAFNALDAILEHHTPEAGTEADESTENFLSPVKKVSRVSRSVEIERDLYKSAYQQIKEKYVKQIHSWKKWQNYYNAIGGQSLNGRSTKHPEVEHTEPVATEDAAMNSSLHCHHIPMHDDCLRAPARLEQKPRQPFGKRAAPSTTQGTEETGSDLHIIESRTSVGLVEDDMPVVVSERPLKRKRRNAAKESNKKAVIFRGLGNSQNKPVHIKEEYSDSDYLSKITHQVQRTETLDLDGLGSKIITPRKHQRFQALLERTQRESFRQRALQELRQERSTSLPVDVPVRSSQLFEIHNTTEMDLSADHNNAVDSVLGTRGIDDPQATNDVVGASSRLTRINRVSGVLDPLSPNVSITALRPRASLVRKGSSNFQEAGTSAVSLVIEDGEDTSVIKQNRRGSCRLAAAKLRTMQRSSSDAIDEKHGRLQALLNTSSSTRYPLSDRTTFHTDRQSTIQGGMSRYPQTGDDRSDLEQEIHEIKQENDVGTSLLREGGNGRRQTSAANKRQAQNDVYERLAPPPPPPPPGGTPLRLLPTLALKLSDFKPNPRTNHELDFAYKETVRSRLGRRCLPGCTDPTCCGATFLRLAENDVLPPREPARGLWESSPSPDSAEADMDTRLLAAYLGISAEAVGCLSAETRQKALVRARAERFANEVGRHRQQWARARSPPGFWNADFPGTQTQERERQEAEGREREKIEERAREARREGGKWIFRDEA